MSERGDKSVHKPKQAGVMPEECPLKAKAVEEILARIDGAKPELPEDRARQSNPSRE